VGTIRAILIHPEDDVAVVTEDAPEGATVSIQSPDGAASLVARQTIPAGHKIAVRDIRCGSPVRKYGEQIGLAIADIRAGDHVHLHNLASDRVRSP
jgi:altronate dehydratase